MRLLLLTLSLFLSGCWSWWGDDDKPELTAQDKGGVVDAYADKGDLVMSRAAAAVEVARDANRAGAPATVEAELGIASTYLPKPALEDLNFAKTRAAKADPAAYAKALAVADAHQRQLDNLWGKVEAEKEKAKAALEAKELELAAARKDKRDTIWTIGGLAGALVGLALLVWGSAIGCTKAEAGAVIALSLGIGSLPMISEAQVSPWVFGGLGGTVALRLAVWAWTVGRKPRGGPNGTA